LLITFSLVLPVRIYTCVQLTCRDQKFLQQEAALCSKLLLLRCLQKRPKRKQQAALCSKLLLLRCLQKTLMSLLKTRQPSKRDLKFAFQVPFERLPFRSLLDGCLFWGVSFWRHRNKRPKNKNKIARTTKESPFSRFKEDLQISGLCKPKIKETGCLDESSDFVLLSIRYAVPVAYKSWYQHKNRRKDSVWRGHTERVD
jgi:hypothetical protein